MNKKEIFKLVEKYLGYRVALTKVSKSSAFEDFEKLKQIGTQKSDFKLHFGCGPRVLKDWINIDLVYEPYDNYLKYYGDEFYPAEIRGTRNDFYAINIIDTGIPLPDNSVNVVFHEDFFEHLTQRDQIVFLAETFRVMKKGAIHRINTPNLIASMKKSSDFAKGKEGVYVQEWDNYGHLSVITHQYISEIAKLVGYSDIQFNSKNGSICKELPKEYRPAGDRDETDGNVFADLIK